MKTVVIIAGNSDNKLTQREWCNFVNTLSKAIAIDATGTEFNGGPCTAAPFQNYCWVIGIDDLAAAHLRTEIRLIRENFGQDAVAWIEGKPNFI